MTHEASTSGGRTRLTALALAMLLLAALAFAGCNKDKTPTPVPTATPIPAPPAFPLIFAGSLTVNGHPGPAGVKIFAQIGAARSLVADTYEGGYRNIILGPSDPANQKGDIHFFLGEPGGKTVEAKQTYPFKMVSQPENVTLDLEFPALP